MLDVGMRSAAGGTVPVEGHLRSAIHVASIGPSRTSGVSAPARQSAPGVVFVTRKFPPSVGGMETLAAHLWTALRHGDDTAVLIAHGGSVPATVLWLPSAVAKLLVLIARGRVGTVLCGDVALYAVLGPLLRLTRTPHAVMAMGLDVTYDSALYRRVALPGLRQAPAVLAISEATAEAVRDAGAAADRVSVVRLGIPAPEVAEGSKQAARRELEAQLGLEPGQAIVVTVGRLVARKGAAWFAGQVLALLGPEVHLVVAGDGPERDAVDSAAREAGVADRVHQLGKVSDEQREVLMRGADLFVAPNVEVPGDMEGFGLVAIEAAMRGTVVVASELEGLRDAVSDGRTGYLLPSGEPHVWAETISALLSDRHELVVTADRFRSESVQRNSLEVMHQQLVECFRDVRERRAGRMASLGEDRSYYETTYHFEDDLASPGNDRLWRAVRLLEPLGGRTFLDLGSGVGWAAALATDRGGAATSVGLDFAFKALHLGSSTVPGVLRVQGDGERLPLTSGSVDRLLSFGSLEHFPDVDAGLAEIERVLSSEGRAVVVVPNFFARTEQPRELRLSYFGWRRRFERAGLRIVATDADAGPPVLRDTRPLRVALRAGAKLGSKIPGLQYQFIFALEPTR